jgi:hypothetical protein
MIAGIGGHRLHQLGDLGIEPQAVRGDIAQPIGGAIVVARGSPREHGAPEAVDLRIATSAANSKGMASKA